MPSFLDLPTELRFEIYRYSIIPGEKKLPGSDQLLHSTSHGFQTSLLRLNKQIHSEAKEIFYRENTFNIEVDYTISCAQVPKVEKLRQQIFQSRTAPPASPIHAYISHIRLQIQLDIPLIDLRRPSKPQCYKRRLLTNMPGICSVLASANPRVRSVEIAWLESSMVTDTTWCTSARRRELLIPLLTLERLVEYCSEMELRALVGRVLEPLGLLPGGVEVRGWEVNGGEGVPEVLSGVTEDWVEEFGGLRRGLSW